MNSKMRIGIVSLFPEMFTALHYGVIGKAIEKKIIELLFWNPRDYSLSKHRNVDDRPFGGGPGMVMMVQPLQSAVLSAKQQLGQRTKVIHLSPQGKLLTQQAAINLSKEQNLIFIASRYEGVDERFIELEVTEEWSIGDYVLSGGELAAMVMIDAIARHIPEVLGHEDSAQQDSFSTGLLDCPHYTRPEEFNGKIVPRVLLTGNHQEIARWRLKQALARTWLRRPDLLVKRNLTEYEQTLLNEFISEYSGRGKKHE